MSTIPIFITTDENYIHYTAIMIASVCYNTKCKCVFYCLADNVSDFRKKQVEELKKEFSNFEINWIDLSPSLKEFIYNTYLPKNTKQVYTANLANYSRFFIPNLLPDIDKGLYIDTDLLCYGDIAELYNQDLDGNIIGAVADSFVMTDKSAFEKVYKYISKQHLYFNAGVMLIDCKKWRENKIAEKIAKCDSEIRDIKLFNTQDPLNKCFEGAYKWLEHKFNWFSSFSNENYLDKDIQNYISRNLPVTDIVIHHFPGNKPDQKPKNFDAKTLRNFWFFASKTVFYPEMLSTQIEQLRVLATSVHTTRVKLFGKIPLLKIRKGNVYLFNFIKLFTVKK